MTRRGLTFIEVVIATAMLTIVGTLIVSSVGFMETRVARDNRRLEAMEVAHRVILQHLDNAESLDALRGRYPYGENVYLFKYNHVIIEEGSSEGEGLRNLSTRSLEQASVEEAIQAGLEQVTVYVYLEDPRRPGEMSGEPLARLRRIYSPLHIFQRDSARLIEWITDLIGGQQGAQQGGQQDGDDSGGRSGSRSGGRTGGR